MLQYSQLKYLNTIENSCKLKKLKREKRIQFNFFSIFDKPNELSVKSPIFLEETGLICKWVDF